MLPAPPASAVDTSLAPLARSPNGVQSYSPDSGFVIYIGNMADGFPEWGTDQRTRDEKLRGFWPSEPYLASAMGSQISRYASFPFVLDGPERTTAIYDSILNGCENGEGFQVMMTKFVTDLYTQDNAAFLELIRSADSPSAPVVSMRHMDAARCRRTGYPDTPVIYWDIKDKPHLLKWYQVITMAEMPSPNIWHRGIQLSVLSRILKAAQIMKAIMQFKLERVTGIKQHEIHLVGGFNQDLLDNTMKQKIATARGLGYGNYVDPVILAALRPDGRVTHEKISLNELPPDFNEDTFMKWYIGNIALAWEDEYQSFFPLPGGNLGTAQQSQTMADKARSKGPAVFMRLVEHKFNYYGVLPKTVKFHYGEQDPAADAAKLQMFWRFAATLKQLLDSSAITPEVAALMMRDAGYLKPQYLEKLNITDPTPQAVSSDDPTTVR